MKDKKKMRPAKIEKIVKKGVLIMGTIIVVILTRGKVKK